jgi:hypothetical protein
MDSGDYEAKPTAMLNLGGLELDQGNVAEARKCWDAAIDTGHPDIAPRAHQCYATSSTATR